MSQASMIDRQMVGIDGGVEIQSDVENQSFEARPFKLTERNGMQDKAETKRMAQKRKPTTPSSAMRSISVGRRRVLEATKSGIQLIDFGEGNSEAFVDAKYQNWLLEQKVARRDALLTFLEKERSFSTESRSG